MKKYLGFVAVAVLAFSFTAAPVFAKDDEGGKDSLKDKRETIKKEIELKRETWKKEFELKREEAKAKFEALKESLKKENDAAKANIKEGRLTGRENALGRFDGAVLRISDLRTKVDAQITKLKAKGVDTAKAEEFSALAEDKLDEAKTKITDATTLLGTSIEKLTPDQKTKLRTLAQETQTLIKEAHSSLGDAVKSLKEAVKAKIKAEKPADTDNDGDENETETEKD